MYQRNRIYISKREQRSIKKVRILIAGAGLGSNIAECALRLGFENITICDMDKVELSNLNRQNYTLADIYESKTKSIKCRLQKINPNANINCYNVYLTKENCDQFIKSSDIAINTIDFNSDAPLVFDEICLKYNVPILHPFNLGWTACTFVVTNKENTLKNIVPHYKHAEVQIVEHIFNNAPDNMNLSWLQEALEMYKEEKGKSSPPQLSPASWFIGGLCTNIIYKIATNKSLKTFPDFYLINS
ncbi:ThiF family adenylyltransferase [Marinifilum sp.]|uniref:ThiF family adenylyltransferase n=1 Tax=Marinifilum sp. TaxID=2033137 RepID=UPI003BAD50E2